MAASAPHRSDGQAVYDGRCRRLTAEQREDLARQRNPAWRLAVPDRASSFRDLLQGMYEENLLRDCGDFILRRSDGVYAYQLAVVVDDAWMGVTQVVRGSDLLSSTPRQRYLLELLGCPAPEYGHVPLLLAPDGRRLAKRDRDQELGALQQRFTAPGAGGPAGPSGGADPGGGPCIPGRAGTPVRLGEAAPAGYRHGALVKEAAVSFRDRRRALCLQQEEADKGKSDETDEADQDVEEKTLRCPGPGTPALIDLRVLILLRDVLPLLVQQEKRVGEADMLIRACPQVQLVLGDSQEEGVLLHRKGDWDHPVQPLGVVDLKLAVKP